MGRTSGIIELTHQSAGFHGPCCGRSPVILSVRVAVWRRGGRTACACNLWSQPVSQNHSALIEPRPYLPKVDAKDVGGFAIGVILEVPQSYDGFVFLRKASDFPVQEVAGFVVGKQVLWVVRRINDLPRHNFAMVLKFTLERGNDAVLPASQQSASGVNYDRMEPGVKAAFASKAVEVCEGLQKCLLYDVLSVFPAARYSGGNPHKLRPSSSYCLDKLFGVGRGARVL